MGAPSSSRQAEAREVRLISVHLRQGFGGHFASRRKWENGRVGSAGIVPSCAVLANNTAHRTRPSRSIYHRRRRWRYFTPGGGAAGGVHRDCLSRGPQRLRPRWLGSPSPPLERRGSRGGVNLGLQANASCADCPPSVFIPPPAPSLGREGKKSASRSIASLASQVLG